MYHLNKQYKDALDCFSRVLHYYSKDKEIYIKWGKVYQDMGNHQFAIEDFNRAIDLAPTALEPYFCWGMSHLKSKAYKDAE